MRREKAIGFALAAALLFGLSTPMAKLLVGTVDPWLLAGVLYLGSGVGLGVYRLSARLLGVATKEASIGARDIPWLTGAILFGGVVGPVCLMLGLSAGLASHSALLLNLEGAFTALVAWLAFREHVGPRIGFGMAGITAGAILLAWQPSSGIVIDRAAVLVAAACLAWAIDNNLTRKVSRGDPVEIAAWKGLVAGTVNVGLALGRGAEWPEGPPVLGGAVVGLFGYGASLALFVRALRHLGAARTSAYFSTAPFVGALGGVMVFAEPVTPALLFAAVLMGVGVWLHLSERHDHEHVHEPTEHEHLHFHDEHHRHDHPPGIATTTAHAHPHVHTALRHAHPHYPDLHHRHRH